MFILTKRGRKTYQNKVGVLGIQGIALVHLGHDGSLAVGGGSSGLIGDVDAEDGDVEEVVDEVHAAACAGAGRTIDGAGREA